MEPLTAQDCRDIAYCTYCPKLCRFACPVGQAEGREAATPWGRQTRLHLAINGFRPWDAELGRLVYQCAACLRCREYCDHGIQVPHVMAAARRSAVRSRLIPNEVEAAGQALATSGNLFSAPLRANWEQTVPAEWRSAETAAALFPGCETLAKHPERLALTLRILERLGVDHVSVPESAAACCGAHADVLGFAGEHQRLATAAARALRPFRQVICLEPLCQWEMSQRYPEFGWPAPRAVSFTDFLSRYMNSIPSLNAQGRPMFYHDPCFLARYLDGTLAPREVLKRIFGAPVREFRRFGKDAACCGGGSGTLTAAAPALALNIARERLAEIADEPDGAVVTACAHCIEQLRAADPNRIVVHIVDVVGAALGVSEDPFQ